MALALVALAPLFVVELQGLVEQLADGALRLCKALRLLDLFPALFSDAL